MQARRKLLFLFIAGAIISIGAYSISVKFRQPPNVVILLVDTLRADRLGSYGYPRNTSPVLDGLAEKGVLFARCYAPSDYTQASTASLFTGQYPLAHGYVNSGYILEDANLTMAEIFREQGYATGAFIANGLAGKKYNMDQGFDEHFEKNRASAEELIVAASVFIERHSERPFFIYMHFMDVHDPYRIPQAYRGRFAPPEGLAYDMQDTLQLETFIMQAWWGTVQAWRDDPARSDEVKSYFGDYTHLYDAAIFYWDEAVGALLDVLAAQGLDQRTIIAVTADHGEQLLEHGYFGHANSGYDVGLHIPFIFCDPRRPEVAGMTIDDPVSGIDILPTLLAGLEVEISPEVQGQERWSLVEQQARGEHSARPPEGIYTEGTFMANRPFSTLIQTFREGKWKLVLDRLRDTKELYDLEQDPGEVRDLFEAESEIAVRLYGKLQQHYTRNLQIFNQQRRSKVEQQEEKVRELLALGYIGGKTGGNRPRVEFFPMRSVPLAKYGPFGDEEDLVYFSEQIDFTRGRVAGGQVIRGYRDRVGHRDASGVWFDRRATFLMPNREGKTRIVFEVWIDSTGGFRKPTQIQVEFNDKPGMAFPLGGPGLHRLEALIPLSLQQSDYFYTGLRANSRFVLREGASPKEKTYGAMKICSVYLEE